MLLNLYNNAFYTVSDKAKASERTYSPTVTISTRKRSGWVDIVVKDNGKGVPDSVREKIFQPFFTTKPTGHGTRLGLSLSYDIVKAHKGELSLESKEGEGATFILSLPNK